MKAARFLGVLLLIVMLLAAATYGFRNTLAGMAVRSGMSSAGLENAKARVTSLGPNGITLTDVRAGPEGNPGIAFEKIEADFDWRTLWSDKKVDAVRIGPGRIAVKMTDDGALNVAGFERRAQQSGAQASLPFSSLSVSNVELMVDAPNGSVVGHLNGEVSVETGGDLSAEIASDQLGWNGVTLSAVKASVILTLNPNGDAEFVVSTQSDLDHRLGAFNNAILGMSGTAQSWRALFEGDRDALMADARIELDIAAIEPANDQLISVGDAPLLEFLFGDPIETARFTGTVDAQHRETGTQIRLVSSEGPLLLAMETGASVTLTEADDEPLFTMGDIGETAAFGFELSSTGLNATGAATVDRNADGIVQISAPLNIDTFDGADAVFDNTQIDLTTAIDGPLIDASIGVSSTITKLTVGRLTVTNAPFAGTFDIDSNLDTKTASIINQNKTGADSCLSLQKGRARLPAQNINLTLGGATLCNNSGELLDIDWSGQVVATVYANLSAARGSISLGQTAAVGRPPSVQFKATYLPEANNTKIDGTLSGGAMVLNDALRLSSAAGELAFSLDAQTLRTSLDLKQMQIAQYVSEDGAAALVAPVIASGTATLVDDDATFTYSLVTPDGNRLGQGRGTHNLPSASGETVLTLAQIAFAPNGIQPEKLAPVLRGIIGATEGNASGVVRSAWKPGELQSSADISFRDVAFVGPTRVVTKTSGFNGNLQFTDLWPVTTDGIQTVTVSEVALDALQLTDGVIAFNMPGDQTVELERAEFPWFSGTLGAYEATASMKDGAVRIPLRAENANLKEMLEFAEIDGLSGEGILSGVLPLVVEDGKARIENGVLRAVGPGVVRYKGTAGDQAAATGEGAKVAFDILRNLQFNELEVSVNGALEGRLAFDMLFEGAGSVNLRNQDVTVPVKYRINLDAALVELLNQARLSTDIRRQIEQIEVGVEE